MISDSLIKKLVENNIYDYNIRSLTKNKLDRKPAIE